MKKRLLSAFMALALCLTLLPTAALAEGTEGTAQTPPAVEKAADPANGEEQQENQPAAPKQENQSAEQEEQQEDSAAKQAVATVQALIDALPAVDELDGMDDDDAMAVYEAFQTACDAYYDTLTEEQQAQLKNTEKLAALSDWFSQPAPLAWSGDIFPDTVDADGNIIRHTGWSRNGPIYEGGNGDADFTDAQFYVVQGNDVTIGGNLTIGGSCGLILCQGATLTVEGALICSGSYRIYGQSDGGAYAGRLVVKNSLDDGAAIRPAADATGTPTLHIDSGELEIHSGNSDKLVDGVKLSSTSHIHQGTLDGTAVSPEVWGETSLKGGTLTLAYCQHEHSADQELIPDSGGATHHRHCKACGFDWASEACDFNNPDHYVPNPEDNANTHFSVCECGNVSTTPAKHEPTAIPTDDGKGHTQRCMYCFYTSTENNPVEEHHYKADGECKNCGFKPAARDAAGNLYESVGDALKAAADGSWVMLETHAEDGGKELREEIEFNDPGKTVELKMNGYTLTNSGNPTLTVENGTLKITGDATINQTGTFSDLAAPAVKVTGGKLIFEGNLTATGASGKPAVLVTGGTLRLKAGDVLNGGVSVAGSTTYANVNALLGDGLAFAKEDEHSIIIVNGNIKSIDENVVVKEHGHSFTLGSDGKYVCACGYTCPHNDFRDGKCTICGNGCAHTNVDENGLCPDCNTQMAAKVEVGDTVTYFADFKEAMKNATNGTKITLLADVSISNRTGISGDNTTVTLDLNGHKITSGWLDVGGKDTNETYTACTLKIIGKGSYEPPMYGGIIIVNMKATLDLSEWEGGTISSINISDNSNYEAATREAAVIVGPKAGTIGNLSFGNNQLPKITKTKLSGGSFNEIWAADFGPVKLGELLAEGYAYQYTDGVDRFVEYTKTLQGESIYNVKVVKCPHAKINEDGHCAYCNATDFVAQVTAADGSSSAYTDIAAAIAAADGGTVKLLANAGEITISSPLKLDLNGKTAAKLTVTGDVTLASLLPEGYAFKSGSTWISDLSGTELTNVSMAKIPIKSMEYPTEMSMTYGGAGTLLVKVAKESGTGAVSFQWYKVEDGKATEVGSATAKNQFDLSALKLPAGQHTFRFSATCDGYKKMSQDIAVTVQRADIKSNLIMPPTAQENLTYTGQPQALITAGMTDYGTMQYSLTENGTYSQDSPVGTEAGAYTVWYRVIGDANHNDTAPASVAVRIGQKPLTITGVTAASKPYDGTTDAGITSVTFDGVTLDRGTDYTVTASFDDADVGSGKNVTATVTLTGQAAKNYALEQSSFTTTGNITKAAVPTNIPTGTLNVINGTYQTYTYDFSKLLPELSEGEYGTISYGNQADISLVSQSGYYYDESIVEFKNGVLTLAQFYAKDGNMTGRIGDVKVTVTTTNYKDFQLTLFLNAVNRITPVPDGTITANEITYGQTLSDSSITGKMKDPTTGAVVEGTFSWQLPGNTILDASTLGHSVGWKFTPKDGNTYTEATGTATVQVGKATQYGKVSMAGYTYGKTPSTPTLTDQTGDLNARVTYSYAAADSGSVQTWDIQNPPALNAGTYRMYASIGDTDNYYGCEAVYCEFVVAKATPTYTAPTGLTAKYGQTLADVTLTDGWSWMDSSESVGGASTAAKTFQAKFTPTDAVNYNMVENIGLEVMVNKADGGNLKTVELEQKYTDASDHTYTPDWAGLPAGQDWTFSSEASIVLSKQDFAADGSLLTYAISGGKAGDKITITLKASCDNYEDFTITLTITLTEKDNQQALRITGGTTVVYGQTLQLGTSGGSGSGAVTYTVTNGTGEATIDSNGVLTPVRIGSVTVTATKAGDSEYNAVTSSPVEITITRATPTGEPAYTKITASGKTLADAALGIGTITPASGTIAWDDPTTTEVVANKSYGWTYTPSDTNYTTLTGSIQLWHKSTSSGGGSYYAPTVPDMPMLYRGCTGDAVKTLQDKLNTLGYNSGNVDGIFGAKTYAAVTAFQKANNLGVDGIVGKLTWAKLYGVSPAMPVETTVVGRPMVSYGSRGDAVRKLQELLNALGYDCGSVDGIFGSKTKAAVLAFQKANGLAADGIVGPLTWGKLV